VRLPDRKGPLGRPRLRWEDNKVDLQEIGWAVMEWTDVPEDRDRRWDLLNAVMNHHVLLNGETLFTS
jgi:hypothetical protein